MSSASSAVTYTSVYTDSEPGRVFWGANEELSDGGSPRVIVYGYDGLPMLPVALPSPDCVPGLEEPQTPPAPQDEDEHEPMFIQPHDLDFVPEPIYPEYIPLEDEHVLPEEDPEEYEDDEIEDGPVDYLMDGEDDGDDDDEDEEEEEEGHLAPADSAVIIPSDELVSPPEGTEPIMPPPSTDTTTTEARITVRLQAAITFLPEAEIERILAMPTPSPSPLTSLSPPSTGERLARCTTSAALPSPPLPPPLHMPPPVDRRDDILETEMPPRKRLCLSTLGSSILDVKARRRGIREVGYAGRLAYGGYDTHQETIQIMEEEAYAAREAWAHLIGLSQAVHSELQTHQKQASDTDGRDSLSEGRHETRDGRHASRVASTA
nr:hypothetical protein [Tanacetum cinerariifolium]